MNNFDVTFGLLGILIPNFSHFTALHLFTGSETLLLLYCLHLQLYTLCNTHANYCDDKIPKIRIDTHRPGKWCALTRFRDLVLKSGEHAPINSSAHCHVSVMCAGANQVARTGSRGVTWYCIPSCTAHGARLLVHGSPRLWTSISTSRH